MKNNQEFIMVLCIRQLLSILENLKAIKLVVYNYGKEVAVDVQNLRQVIPPETILILIGLFSNTIKMF